MDTARVSTYGAISEVPHLSKRFALKRFLGLTAEEIAENEQMWREENVDIAANPDVQSDLRSVGVTSAGLGGDLESLGSADLGPESLQSADTTAPGASPVGTTPSGSAAPAGGPPPNPS